jgi:glycosyltransferase involved in cell wall biosynthesis
MKLSIVLPVRNGGSAFAHSLEAAQHARAQCHALAETELIVVDDGSTDDSAARARAAGARVLFTTGGRGPAVARNLGARAAIGDFVFFVDADVALHPDALRCAAEAFTADLTLQACFGSYDDAPSDPNFLSQYKNLFHHYVHQHARAEASTFWTGCGAMRLATFQALGGFDETTYRRPSIEDIDLGYRLRRRGGKIALLKEMQCKHLKRWTARSLLRSDIFERGIPWTVLLWRESQTKPNPRPQPRVKPFLLDLNLQTSNRLSVFLVGLLALASGLAFFAPQLWLSALGLAGLLLWLNHSLYLFFFHKRGARFALAAIGWHWLYYLYNSLSFGLGTWRYFVRGVRPITADGALTFEGAEPD